jgi:hypothetical protein
MYIKKDAAGCISTLAADHSSQNNITAPTHKPQEKSSLRMVLQ